MKPPFFLKKPAGIQHLEISRVINSFYGGVHRSVLGGKGSEFKNFRPYDPSDNLRVIDWPTSAKISENPELEPVSRVYNPERQISVVLAVDLSPSMSHPFKKLETAFGILWLFFLSAFRYRDRTKAIFFANASLADSDWLFDESALEIFMKKSFFPAQKAPDCSILELARHLGGLNLYDTLFVMVSDFNSDFQNMANIFRRLDFQKRNIKGLAFRLDEWSGFNPVKHGVLLKDPESGKILSADLRRNSRLSKIAEKSERAADSVALSLRPLGFSFINLSLVADPMAEAGHKLSKIIP